MKRITTIFLMVISMFIAVLGCSCSDCNSVTAPVDPGDENPVEDSTAEYTIERTLADNGQKNTIAFDALAFLTGNLGAQSFLPPGKVADFSGFQYLRDNDQTEMGHNTDFVTIIAYNVLNILSQAQLEEMIDRAESQIDLINQYAYARYPLMNAFRRLLEGDLPTGTTGLDKAAVVEASAELYRIDGEISYERAELLGGIICQMTPAQIAILDSLSGLGGVGNWDRNLTDPLRDRQLSRDVNVAVMTYASEMFSWYAGSVVADTYFCPERQGTYFGSFFLKDWPAMGNPDYTIDEQLTARAGEDFQQVLTANQAALISGLVDTQKTDLFAIVDTREEISTELRRFMSDTAIDRAAVMSLSEQYGELDGAIVYEYATQFAAVNSTMTSSQRNELESLVSAIGYLHPDGAFLYSQPIAMPVIENTDYLFGATQEEESFILSSSEVSQGGELPTDYTCDGASATLPLAWAGAPEGTESFVLIMDHIASPTDIHWYWLLYDIPAEAENLPRNVTGVGTLGSNSVNGQVEYAPPCSQGPGAKNYTYTLYALSAPVELTVLPADVTRDLLLAAIGDRTLSSATLSVTYARP